MSLYYFILSSLPTLKYGEPPPIKSDDFLSVCATWLDAKKYEVIKNIELVPKQELSTKIKPYSALDQWHKWETCLRNRIVRARKTPFSVDPAFFIRPEKDYFSEIDAGIQDAFSSSNPLNKEKIIETMRWKRLNELESGHMFDFYSLCIYRLKLLLLEKSELRKVDAGRKNFDEIIDKKYNPEFLN